MSKSLKFPESLDHDIEKAQETIAEFQGKLIQDPHNALHWVDASVSAASTLHVFGAAKRVFLKNLEQRDTTKETVYGKMLEYATKKLHEVANGGASRSSAVLDTSLRAEDARAWSRIIEVFTWDH